MMKYLQITISLANVGGGIIYVFHKINAHIAWIKETDNALAVCKNWWWRCGAITNKCSRAWFVWPRGFIKPTYIAVLLILHKAKLISHGLYIIMYSSGKRVWVAHHWRINLQGNITPDEIMNIFFIDGSWYNWFFLISFNKTSWRSP